MIIYLFLKVLLCVNDFSSSVMETSLYARLNVNQVVGLEMEVLYLSVCVALL